MKSSGFTLIELATVICIIGIIAAFAILRTISTTASAECATIKDMVSQLTSAGAAWTSENTKIPTSFDEFVTEGPLADGKTLSLESFGPASSTSTCKVAGTQITCSQAFTSYNPTYVLENGAIRLIKPVPTIKNGIPVCQ